MNRRKVIGALVAGAIMSGTEAGAADAVLPLITGHNLVPDFASNAPNYWCTWGAQNKLSHALLATNPKALEGVSGKQIPRAAMTEENVFGDAGWARVFYPKVRKDLFFLLDDGWEVGGFSSFVLDEAKFPSFTGAPMERLKRLNRMIQANGWRGAALWCRNTPGGDSSLHLEMLSQAAGVEYWKIDLGDPTFDLIRLRDKSHIPLTLEHVHGEPPLNGEWARDGRFGSQAWGSSRSEILRHTDVYRTYDATSTLSLPTTLDRLTEMLKAAEGHSEVHGLLNVEDEVYVAAVMGCTTGIMRYPLMGMPFGNDTDLFFYGPRQVNKRMDEVVRSVRWQRIAPPFSPGVGSVLLSEEILTDSWTFERGQTWYSKAIGFTARQGAPACLARNIALPEVHARGDKPFVFAAKFPNGAVAIAAQERTQVGHAWYMPECDVTLDVSDAPGPFGVFGFFESLTLKFEGALRGKRVWAQDLAGDHAIDISYAVQIRGASLRVPGEVIRQIGLSNATAGDISAPGLVIAIV